MNNMGNNAFKNKDKNMKSRNLLIYYAKDSLDTLETYSEYFLNKIIGHFDDLIIVSCTEELDIKCKNIRAKLIKHIMLDKPMHCLEAYNTGIQFAISENCVSYSQLICISDSIMGPVQDLSELFSYMSKKECDFWGITKQNPTPLNSLDYTGNNLQKEYLLPDFLVFKGSLLKNNDLRQILDAVERIENPSQTLVDLKALYLMSELLERGYHAGNYVDTEDLSNMYYNPLLMVPKDMLEKRNCPVFLKESFLGDYDAIIANTSGQAAVKLYHYLDHATDYDVDMIWETILKTGHQQDISFNMHLNYILSSTKCDHVKLDKILKKKNVALVMHLYYPDLLDNSLQYAYSMPEGCDIYVTTNNVEKKKAIEQVFSKLPCNKLEVRIIQNRGRDVSSLLTGVKDVIMDYDYVCFAHDKKSTQIVPGSIGHDFGYQCFENILCSKEYVGNIICAFYDNKRLGMLSPLYAVHGTCYPVYGIFDWGANFDNTKALAGKLGLTIPISSEKSPVAPLGTMFWFRPKALKPLYDYNWQYSDFPKEPNGYDGTLLHAIERIYSFVVQQQGYYPAMVGNKEFTNMSLTNMTYFLQGINRTIEKCQGFCSYSQALYSISKTASDLSQLRIECEELKKDNCLKQDMIDELLPRTSLKWQLKDRLKRMIHINKR